ncbi:MAG: NAD(P)/FAD-dependent oxidoreductase [Candidatus Hodarchaeota archaeon]
MENSTKVFDVIVVGAGPGGSMAAQAAADYGLSTCLLEKETLAEGGRYKACGGALDWKIVKEINYPEEKIERIIDSLELHHVDGEIYSKKGKGAVVWRSTFDKYLADIAVESGAILKENESLIAIEKVADFYKIMTNKNKYITKYVICADGVSSPTLKRLQWGSFARENIILTITQEMALSKSKIDGFLGRNTIHLFFGIRKLIPVGYAWLFPKKEIITVGWGNQLTLVTNVREEHQKFLNLPFVTETLRHAQLNRFKAHLIPVGLRSKLYKEKVFAVGDAGGFVDPISGKGIPFAMMSGTIAIDTIIKSENRDKPDNMGSYYESTLDKKFLQILKAKRPARDRIFQKDETLKKFLALWEKYRSSEIVMRQLI